MRALVAIAIATLACASSSPSVRLDWEWPSEAGDYEEAHRKWTRHASTQADDLVLAIDAHATLKSPEWRAAFVREFARRAKLLPGERKELLAEQRADAENFYEIQLVVATHHYGWDDFSRPTRSMWEIDLIAEDGRSVEPSSVVRDHREDAVIDTWFPDWNDFYSAYTIRFPRTAPDGKPLVSGAGDTLTLRIGSALGHVEMSWGGG